MDITYPDSANILTERLVYFARMCSKIKLMEAGTLPEAYHPYYSDGFDGRTCRFLKVTHDAVKEQVLSGKSNEEVLAWCYQTGYRPNDEEVFIWNAFMTKRGWMDDDSPLVQADKEEAGLGDRDDIVTWFQLYEYEEGRKS